MPKRRPPRLTVLVLALALAASGCRATGRAANAYFDWGGRTFTTNPISVAPYFIGFTAFFIAGLPLDLFTWIATAIAWPEGRGEDYQGSALAPSIFLGTTGGTLLGAPFWPLGLPWWDPGREDAEPAPEPKKDVPEPKKDAPKSEETTAPDPAASGADPGDIPAGAPKR